jgi:hypothetical protein
MNAKKVLTGSQPEAAFPPELERTLAEAGLELWQAPEGFWAIRLKAPTLALPPRRERRRRLEGQR